MGLIKTFGLWLAKALTRCPWRMILKAIIAIGSLVLIGCGIWLIYPPAAFIAVGLLLWLDLSIGSLRA